MSVPSKPAVLSGYQTPMIVHKGWGYEEWIVNNELYCGKRLHLLRNGRCSLHAHPVKHETFHIVSGQVWLWTVRPSQISAALEDEDNALTKKMLKDAADILHREVAERWTRTHAADGRVPIGHTFELNPGDTFALPPGTFHQFKGLQTSEIFEFSTPHDDADVVRAILGDQL